MKSLRYPFPLSVKTAVILPSFTVSFAFMILNIDESLSTSMSYVPSLMSFPVSSFKSGFDTSVLAPFSLSCATWSLVDFVSAYTSFLKRTADVSRTPAVTTQRVSKKITNFFICSPLKFLPKIFRIHLI